jgi:argininosuccinate lyase
VTLWAGRVEVRLAPEVWAFLRSHDAELLPYDCAASRVHARRLHAAGVLSDDEYAEADEILVSLDPPAIADSDEDVHSAIERALGEVGRKIHAGRSRNDQVAAAMRLYVEDACAEAVEAIGTFARAVLDVAEAEAQTVMPGYTHLQRAQPVTLGWHLLAWVEMLDRDRARFRFAAEHAAESPLGAGALAGSTLTLPSPPRAMRNTLDAVADRDFVCDLLYACALGFVHLSRFAEEVIVFATQEFAFAQLDDTIALGSSMMPQKKNPQVAEHLRGRAGVAIGRLAAMLAVCKGLPLAYDSDLQEDKELAFAQVAAYDGALRATALLVAGLQFDAQRMRAAAADGACVATDVAEALVLGGLPFREAHEQVASRLAAGERFAEPTPEEAVAARNAPGGTAPARVEEQLSALTWRVAATRAWAKA